MIRHQTIEFPARGRGIWNLTEQVQHIVRDSGASSGLCTVFIHHTSASLIISENADPAVQRDLQAFMQRLVPDGDPLFAHTDEGPDDMPSHMRSVLTQTSLGIPITQGRCDLGTWQGIYLWEHRQTPHRRRITVTIIAD